MKQLYKLYLKIAQWQTAFTDKDLTYMAAFNKQFGVIQNFTPFEWPPDYFAPTSENKSVLKLGQSTGINSLNQDPAPWVSSKYLVDVEGPLRYVGKADIAAFYIYANNKDEGIL